MSRPTQARKSPKNPAIQPLMTKSGLVSVPEMIIPKKARRKNSKEVNWSAKKDIIGEMQTRNSMLMIVPMADDVVVKPMALPPSPLRARGYPSRAVAAEAAVPGIFIRMAE